MEGRYVCGVGKVIALEAAVRRVYTPVVVVIFVERKYPEAVATTKIHNFSELQPVSKYRALPETPAVMNAEVQALL